MGTMQLTKEFLLKHIEKLLILLYPSFFLIFWSYLWQSIPVRLAQYYGALSLSRAIVILCWLLFFFLVTTFYFLYQNYSKNIIKRKLLKYLIKHLNILTQLEHNTDALRCWINNADPLLNSFPEYKRDFIDYKDYLFSQDRSIQIKGRQKIIGAMEKAIATLRFELGIPL